VRSADSSPAVARPLTIRRSPTIRYISLDIYLLALKSSRHGQLNLSHGTKTKNKGKTKNKKPSGSEETVRVIGLVHEGNPEGRSETTEGFVKQVGLSRE